MALLIGCLLVVAGVWLAWKVVKFAARLALIGGVAAVIYFVVLPRLSQWL